MALPANVQAAIDRFNAANNNAYNAATNPFGHAQGGHRQNFVQDLQGMVTLVSFTAGQAASAAQNTALTSEDASNTALDRIATGQDVLTSAGKVTLAAAEVAKAADEVLKARNWAGAAEGVEVEPGLFSAFHWERKARAWAAGVSLPAISAANAFQFLRVKADGSGYEAAAVDVTAKILRSARTANAMIVKADQGKFIDITSGTFTQTFDTAATLGDGWFCYLRNGGSGDITLDPNGSETIDGLASFIMYPGEVRLLQCDGATLRTIVMTPFSKVFTASDNFIKPPGYGSFSGFLWAGAGSGAKAPADGNAAGGGGGPCVPFELPAFALSASTPVTIGAGGIGPSVANTAGASGGSSTFGPVKAFGGAGGSRAASGSGCDGGGGGGWYSAAAGPSGGGLIQPTANSFPVNNGFGGGTANRDDPDRGHSVYGGAAGNSVQGNGNPAPGCHSLYGGAGGAAVAASTSVGTPGTSVFGGNGGAASSASSGSDGVAPAGGGGATVTGAKAGNGARGELRIRGVA